MNFVKYLFSLAQVASFLCLVKKYCRDDLKLVLELQFVPTLYALLPFNWSFVEWNTWAVAIGMH